MAEEFTRQLYAKRVGTTRTSRFRLIEKSRIGEIVASVRRIGAAPAQTKMLAIAPDIFIRGYLHHTRHTDERNRDLSDRANRHYASAARPQRFASHQGYDYTGETGNARFDVGIE